MNTTTFLTLQQSEYGQKNKRGKWMNKTAVPMDINNGKVEVR